MCLEPWERLRITKWQVQKSPSESAYRPPVRFFAVLQVFAAKSDAAVAAAAARECSAPAGESQGTGAEPAGPIPLPVVIRRPTFPAQKEMPFLHHLRENRIGGHKALC